MNKLYQDRQIDINCIYFDKNINGKESFSCSYGFFKILKRSIKGVFFGIKTVEYLRYLKVQLNKDFKFVLVYAGKENEQDISFFKAYHSYFSHIIIFTIDKDDIVELRKYKNLYAIESEYENVLLRLTEINAPYDKKIANSYRPYDLFLLSEYYYFKNIRACHSELLKHIYFKEETNNINNELSKGLTKEEKERFIWFLNQLKEIDDIVLEEDEFNNEEDNYIIEDEESSNINKNSICSNEIDNCMNIYNIRSMRSENENLNNNNKDNFNDGIRIELKLKYKISEEIEKTPKRLIEEFLTKEKNYAYSKNLILLYTKEDEKFYKYINNWLLTMNYDIYKEIGPIAGKCINYIYSKIYEQNRNYNNIGKIKKLIRCFSIKKADIFLYKACEGDIFFYPSFTSTSSKFKEAIKFNKKFNVTMKNLSEKCNCIISIYYNVEKDEVFQEGDISETSDFSSEEERLFPPFSFFKIKKVKFTPVKDDITNNIIIENDIDNEGNNNNTKNGKIYDGTREHPFRISLEIIKRNFYLDYALKKELKIGYLRDKNKWTLVK